MEKVSKRNRREEKEATDLFASTDPFLKVLGRNERREFVNARKELDIMILGCVGVVIVLV